MLHSFLPPSEMSKRQRLTTPYTLDYSDFRKSYTITLPAAPKTEIEIDPFDARLVPPKARENKRKLNPYELQKEQQEKRDADYEKSQPSEGFRLPCRVAMVGSTGSGKTFTFINKMLTNPNVFKGKFRRIVCFSPTMKVDPVWQQVYTEDKGFVIYPKYDDEIVGRIFEEQMQIKELYPDDWEDVLIFVDDNAYETRSANNHKHLDRAMTIGRHARISIVVCVQKMVMLNRTQREQMSNFVLWSTMSSECLDAIQENCGAFVDKNALRELLRQNLAEQFSLMNIRKVKGGVMQICKDIDEVIIPNVNLWIPGVEFAKRKRSPASLLPPPTSKI